MSATFIPDGFTAPFFIEAAPGLHGSLRGQYRPCVDWEVEEFLARDAKLEGKAKAENAAKFSAGRLTSWDLRTPATAESPDGNSLPISPVNAARLGRRLAQKLLDIVLGGRPSDVEPDKPDPVPGAEQLASDQKN